MNDILFLLWNNLPWLWVVLTIVFVIIESLTLALTTIWFAIAAFIMVFVSLTKIPFQFQIIIFAAMALTLLFFTRPIALKKLNEKRTSTNANSLIGTEVMVIEPVEKFKKGTVQINGIIWSAQSADDAELPSGTKCIVTEIKGNTLILRNLI